MSQLRKRILPPAAVALMIAVVLLPLAWVVRVALKSRSDFDRAPGSWSGALTLENFADAWRAASLDSALSNSARVVFLGATLTVLVASLAAFGLSRYRFPFRRTTHGLLVVSIFVPIVALVLPIFDQALSFGILGSHVWLGVVYAALMTPWTTLFLEAYIRDLPDSVFEAAALDGAGPLRSYWSVALPMSGPALATAWVLNIFIQWSELLLALVFLPASSQQTASVAVAQFQGQFDSGGPPMAAAILIVIFPVLVVFLVAQRWLRAGTRVGADR